MYDFIKWRFWSGWLVTGELLASQARVIEEAGCAGWSVTGEFYRWRGGRLCWLVVVGKVTGVWFCLS